MDVDFVKTSIKSYKKRLEGRKEDAIAAIKDGSYWVAEIALGECIGFEATIAELEFQLDASGDDDERY